MEIVLGLLKHQGEWDYFWLLKKVGFIVIFLGIWTTCITIMIRNHRKNQSIKRYFNNHHQEAGWRMAMSGNNNVAHNDGRSNDHHMSSCGPIIPYHHHGFDNSHGAPQMGAFTDYTSHLSGYPTMYTESSISPHDFDSDSKNGI